MSETDTETQARLDSLLDQIEELSQSFAGYPCNLNFDYSELFPFLKYCVNNVGDPFDDSNFRLNTHALEREVIAQFADLLHLDQQQAWGYVTSGGTEGNMYGLYMGRELLPDGVVYFSQDTHYSVVKLLRVLKARNIMLKSQDNGEVDYLDLYETIRINRDVPVIFMANIGTTMKGAVDDVRKVRDILDDLAVTNYYIHGDAALSGMILPFVEHPRPYGFDAGFDSIAISGHKLIGCPIPCGVALTKRNYVARIARSIEYVGCTGYHLDGVTQRADATHALVRAAEVRVGRLSRDRGGDAGGGAVRRRAVQRAGHSRLAQRAFGHGCVPQTVAGGGSQVADCSLWGHCPHHHYAPGDT